MNCGEIRQISFSFFCFFCQNMAFVSMFSLDLSRTRYRKSFLCSGVCLHFWHYFFLLFFINNLYFFFFPGIMGENNIIIFFPSSFGNCSTFPNSSRSWANHNRRISPFSLYSIVRPLKNTKAFNFAPSLRNFRACLSLKL